MKLVISLLSAVFLLVGGMGASGLLAASQGNGKDVAGKKTSVVHPSGKTRARQTQKKQTQKQAAGKTIAPKAGGKANRTASKTPNKKTVGKTPPKSSRNLARKHKTVRLVAQLEDDAWSGDPRTLRSSSVLVLDQRSGKILLEKNPDSEMPIASISKLMTAMVTLDAGQDMEALVTISEADVDFRKGTHSRLPVGTAMTRDTALLLALMSSENRAASVLARHYPGGMRAFVAAMNAKARALGLLHTHFEEPTGLSVRNVSTPRDLARMTASAYQYAKIREYSTMAEAHLEVGGNLLVFNNTNALVKNAQWRIGLSKTGYISESGHCLVMQAWVNGEPVIMVLMDASGKMSRVGDANRIKRWMRGTEG
jgi:D-alanyl-D-alanine endopeptidase (penicillin-binding protein 7)